MEQLSFSPDDAAATRKSVGKVIELTNFIASSAGTILDWLRHEFGLEKPSQALSTSQLLDAETFTAAVRKALPKSKKLSAAEIARLKQGAYGSTRMRSKDLRYLASPGG